MNHSFTKTKKQAKTIRLVGDLLVNINGQKVKVSDSFRIQTDIAYSGMSVAEQETVLKAIETALAGNADISFTANLEAQQVKSQARATEPSPLDLLLAAANKPKQDELVEAVVRDDKAKSTAHQNALDILGASALPPAMTVKS